ncbi:magnesium transporter [Halomonas campisalis]|uniref:Magnesium transporter MgtE n=1 Tax=Billgrantia campisalis TaxID=74661 RepID=A0ABS9PCS7_9GAMM|nr:magnesium transporter [Halomonas campisalis]MCG6659577.1 magnesium transporter [Halomonas campisalis]MDR5864537.1 magnesium transporter [Halomonas campisalis]
MTAQDMTPQQQLQQAMQANDSEAIRACVTHLHPADLAEACRDETPYAALALLSFLSAAARAATFTELPADRQRRLSELMTEEELGDLLESLAPDARADLFKRVETGRRDGLLRYLPPEEQDQLKRLVSYPEGTAGALMSPQTVTVPANYSVQEVLAVLRRHSAQAETIYQIYAVDEADRLVGTLSLRKLILARPSAPVADYLTREVLTVEVTTPQESVAEMIARYDLLAIPVVEPDGRLVGIVTYDDAMDVAEEEATEDIHRQMSIGRLEGSVSTAHPFELYRKRVGWLVLLVFANVFTGAGIAHFEATIEAYIALVFFLPLLVDSSGNAGAQAATLMVRGMATGDVHRRDWARLLGREIAVAASLGLTMAACIWAIGTLRAGSEIATVVAISMVLVVLVGSVIGMLLPLLLDRLGLDPATASAPLVTSIADIVGVVLYFALATAVLGLPA